MAADRRAARTGLVGLGGVRLLVAMPGVGAKEAFGWAALDEAWRDDLELQRGADGSARKRCAPDDGAGLEFCGGRLGTV